MNQKKQKKLNQNSIFEIPDTTEKQQCVFVSRIKKFFRFFLSSL